MNKFSFPPQQSNETGGITDIVVRDIFDSAVGAHVAEVRGTFERDRDHQPNFACTAFLAVDIGTLPLVHHAQQRHSYVASHMRRRIHACQMRRRIHASRAAAALLCRQSYEEEDTCMSYEEEDTCITHSSGTPRGGGYMHVI